MGIDRKAADVRLHRFREQGNLPHSSGQSQQSDDEIDQHESPSVTGSLQTVHSAPSQAQAPVMKRTISDVALEALESVESLKCPVIQYSALQFKRKIGQGSVGQVCLPSSSVPFTLACMYLAICEDPDVHLQMWVVIWVIRAYRIMSHGQWL